MHVQSCRNRNVSGMRGGLECRVPLRQWSPALLAPGTGFVEDNFSTDGAGVGGRGGGSGGNASNGE